MASTTKVLKVRKALKRAAAAKDRKRIMRNKGSTAPNLTLNVPNANELAMKKAAGKL